MDINYSNLLDIGLGGMAFALYTKISPLLDKTSKLVDLMGKQLKDHEERITELERK